MPSQFPNSPKLAKGALLEFGDAVLGLLPNVILFQYNPEQLSRKLDSPGKQTTGSGKTTTEKKEDFRAANLPVESISDLKLILDATDQMEQGDPITAARGIAPAIAALEMMMFPIGSSLLNVRKLLSTSGSGGTDAGSKGSANATPFQLPLVLFVWGLWRAMPVNVTSVSVVEQEFDPLLNPIRAEVSVSLAVIPGDTLDKKSYAYGAYAWTQANREANAALNLANTARLAAGMLPL